MCNWVACDKCDTWRRVAQNPTADKWYCSDNPDEERSACSVPQELSDAAIDIELNRMPSTEKPSGSKRRDAKEQSGSSKRRKHEADPNYEDDEATVDAGEGANPHAAK